MRTVSEHPTDVTRRARIRDIALRLFAEHGFERVSGRMIAKEANVSAALVMHHFGSVEALRREIDEWVLDHFRLWMEHASEAGSTDEIIERTGREVRDFFRSEPLLGRYLRRLLTEGGEVGFAFFEGLFEAGRQFIGDLVDQGAVRPAANGDEDARLMLLMAEDLGVMMLEPYLTRILGGDLYSDALMDRWHDAELDLHVNGLLTVQTAGERDD